MIIAEQKTIAEISALIKNFRKILLLGCGSCVTVCLTGGEKETEIMASALRIKRRIEKIPVDIQTCTVTRQCDPEFIDNIQDLVRDVDAVVSLACGVGPQYLAERYQDKHIIPAMNTTFAGGAKKAGVWEERCALCGDCNLHLTAGICPITLCPKSILNGPCGGAQNGRCEIRGETDCVWQLIYERLKKQGRLELLKEVQPPKDWSKSRDGGPRRMTREDMMFK
ncbi:MAG: methylenetetrahydrofolate reductase C-terminal domain-containing protein [Desulfotomaculaceae bacterium]